MPGLSSDPAKRRRQLEALARGSERRSETLRARLDELDAEIAASEAASDAPSEAELEAAPAPPSRASSEAPSAARIMRGSYGAVPDPSADEVGPAPDPDETASEPETETEAPIEDEPAAEGPGRLIEFGAGLLGVDRKG